MITHNTITASLFSLVMWCCVMDGASAQTSVRMPDAKGQEMLIKNTITAVNHGMITGNYTVLRDLSSEQFRLNNSAGDLAATFGGLKKQNLDLSPILVTTPTLFQPASLDKTGQQMALIGFFETQPQAVLFSLRFRVVRGGWMIDEITINIRPTETVRKALSQRREMSPRSVPAKPAVSSGPPKFRTATVTKPDWYRK